MPWWTWTWIAVMALLTGGGVVMDVAEREPPWYTALGALTGLACIAFVLEHFGGLELWNTRLLAGVTLAGLLYEAWGDFADERELSSGWKLLGVVLALAPFLPAVLIGLQAA